MGLLGSGAPDNRASSSGVVAVGGVAVDRIALVWVEC